MVIIKNNFATALSHDQDSIISAVRLFTKDEDHYSHRVRFALQIKKVKLQLEEVEDVKLLPPEIKDLNLDHSSDTLPILMERELILHNPDIIMQYIEERFPTPPLMPLIPQERALFRSVLHQVESSIVVPADAILKEKNKFKATEIARGLRDNLISFSFEYFEDFESQKETQELDVIDCILAPILWRLKVLGINIRGDAQKYQPLMAYMNYIFKQSAFINSCSTSELKLHSG